MKTIKKTRDPDPFPFIHDCNIVLSSLKLNLCFSNRPTKRVERKSVGKQDERKRNTNKEQRLHNHEFSLRSGDLKDINYYLKEDLDTSSEFDDYEISPSIFPSKKKHTKMEYSSKKGTQVLKEEAKKRAIKREIHDKKRTPHFKFEEREVASHHMPTHRMSTSSYDDHDDGNPYDMKIDVDILSESFNKLTSFNKLFFSERSLKGEDGSVGVSRCSNTVNKKKDKVKKLFQGMKRRLSIQ